MGRSTDLHVLHPERDLSQCFRRFFSLVISSCILCGIRVIRAIWRIHCTMDLAQTPQYYCKTGFTTFQVPVSTNQTSPCNVVFVSFPKLSRIAAKKGRKEEEGVRHGEQLVSTARYLTPRCLSVDRKRRE